MNQLAFAHPYFLVVGALACAGAASLMARGDRLRRRVAVHLAGTRAVSSVGRGRRVAKRALVLLGTACAFLALARPRWGYQWEAERQTGVDLMFAVDTSKSMRAQDLRPDRLTRAKLAVADLLREFPGERVGLIAFAGTAFVQAPMTLDQTVFSESLDALDTDVIPRGGTNIASAIGTAVHATASEPDHRKVLVILTDGENLEGDALAAAKAAARAGLTIYAVGVGTPAGQLVPIDRDGRPGPMLDDAGQPVRSRLDEKTLHDLAAATGGAYAALGADGRGLETLYRQHLAALPRRAAEERMHKVWTERFQIPLAAAIACLLAELALGERRRFRARGAGLGAAAALVLLVGGTRPAAAAPTPASARPGEHAATTTYNDGTAAYRKRDFDAAKSQFQSATHTTDLGLQEDAYYDLGNTRYRIGEAALAHRDREAARSAWKEALSAYDGALALAPKDADARFNRDFVARRLKALEAEERQQPDRNQSPSSQRQDGHKGNQGGQNQSSPKAQGGGQSQGAKSQGSQNGSSQGAPSQSGEARGNGPQDEHSQAPTLEALSPASTPKASGTANDSAAPGQQSGAPRPGARPGQQPAAAPPSPTPKGPGLVGGGAEQAQGAKGDASAAAARREPGALTSGEAKQLLDSVNGELRRLPAAGDSRGQPSTEAKPERDW